MYLSTLRTLSEIYYFGRIVWIVPFAARVPTSQCKQSFSSIAANMTPFNKKLALVYARDYE